MESHNSTIISFRFCGLQTYCGSDDDISTRSLSTGSGCRELQHHGGECCLTAKRFELGQVLNGRLATFAGELQPMILMDARGALRSNADRGDNPQPLDELRKIPRPRRVCGLP